LTSATNSYKSPDWANHLYGRAQSSQVGHAALTSVTNVPHCQPKLACRPCEAINLRPICCPHQPELPTTGSYPHPIPTLPSPMPPHFGPLSAERIELTGLTKYIAMGKVCQEIRQEIRKIAPSIPEFQLLHKQSHKVTGPWLCVGTEGQLNAGCWYLAVSAFNPVLAFLLTLFVKSF